MTFWDFQVIWSENYLQKKEQYIINFAVQDLGNYSHFKELSEILKYWNDFIDWK